MESNLGLVIRRASLVVSGGLLLVAVVYLAFGWSGSWNHQTVDDVTFYWAGIVYVLTAFPLIAISGLAFVAFAILWVVGRRVQGIAVLLALGALLLTVAASFPSALVRIYHHVSAEFGDHMYHLALRMAVDGDNAYILFECDSLGLVCRSVAIGAYSPPEQIAVLNADPATNKVEVQIGNETVYTYSPP